MFTMKFNEFKKVRSLALSNIKVPEQARVYEYMQTRYELDENLNEGILSSISNWVKRHFSPTASKLKDLSNEYYAWLINEYTSTYKGAKKDTALDEFYRREKVSNDIESKMKSLGEKGEVYQKLANELILDSRLKAKKDYATRLLGMKSAYATSMTKKYAAQHSKVDAMYTDMSSDDVITFKENVDELSNYIAESEKWMTSDQADKMAVAITKFFQLRKVENFMSYDIKKLTKSFDNCEKKYFENRTQNRHDKGVMITNSIRCFEGSRWLKLNTITAKDLEDQKDKIFDDITELITVNDRYWGFIELYLLKRTQEGRDKVLSLISNLKVSVDESHLIDIASDVEDMIADGSDSSITTAEDYLENSSTKTSSSDSEDDSEDDSREEPTDNTEEEPDKKEPYVSDKRKVTFDMYNKYSLEDKEKFIEKYTGIVRTSFKTPEEYVAYFEKTRDKIQGLLDEGASKRDILKSIGFTDVVLDMEKTMPEDFANYYLDAIAELALTGYEKGSSNTENTEEPESKPDDTAIFDKVGEFLIDKSEIASKMTRDMILTVGTASKNENGKIVFNQAVRRANTLSYRQGGIDPHKKGINETFLKNAQSYITTQDTANPLASKIDPAKLKNAADYLIEDAITIAKRSKENAENILSFNDSMLSLFFLRLLKYKKLAYSEAGNNFDLWYNEMLRKEYQKTLI